MSSRPISGIFVCLASIAVCAGDPHRDPAEVVASVNGEAVTAGQLETVLRPQLQVLEDRIRQMRQAALDKLINNLLLQQAARREGITVDRLLQVRVESVSVSTAEVDAAYESSRTQFTGILPAEAKYRIRRTLEDNQRAATLNRLIDGLRQNAKITNRAVSDAMATLEAAAHEGPSAGPPEAPITLIEFSDFQCPYCKAAQPVIKRVIDRWPGRIRHVFKHFPLDQHPFAMQAARAAVCADRQGGFWAVHDRIFATADTLNPESLRSAAVNTGLRMGEFESCMRSDEPTAQVQRDVLVGRTAGVTGTPAFFVNRELVPAAELESAVERILGGSK